MTAKEYLTRVRNAERELRLLEREYERCRADIVSLKGMDYGKDKISSNHNCDLSDAIARLEGYGERLNEQWDKLVTLREEAKARIDQLSDVRYQEILEYRYILCESWEAIAYLAGYNYRWVTRLHGQALAAFEKEALESPYKNVI